MREENLTKRKKGRAKDKLKRGKRRSKGLVTILKPQRSLIVAARG